MTSKGRAKARIGRPPSKGPTTRRGMVRIISYVEPDDAELIRTACQRLSITRGQVLALGAQMAAHTIVLKADNRMPTAKRCKRCNGTSNLGDPHVNADGSMFCLGCVDELQEGDYLGQGGRS